MAARGTGKTPWELIHGGSLEFDFNMTVMWSHYLEEQAREDRRAEATAIMTANNLARIIAPALGLEIKDDGGRDVSAECTHTFDKPGGACVFCGATFGEFAEAQAAKRCPPHRLVNGGCVECDYVVENGVARYGEMPIECEEHDLENGVCRKCGGREWGGGLVTKGSPRVIGNVPCEHKYSPLNDSYMMCEGCGHMKQKRHFEEQAI